MNQIGGLVSRFRYNAMAVYDIGAWDASVTQNWQKKYHDIASSVTQAGREVALTDVKKAVPQATLLEVTPDFVGLTDVAELVCVSRQNMRKLMLAHPLSFPAPLHEGSAALWHLAPVLQWLKARDGYRIEQPLLDVAATAMQINLAKEAKQIEKRVQRAVLDLVA